MIIMSNASPDDLGIGSIFESNNCGQFEIVNYVSSKEVLVRFLKTGYTITTQASHIRRGKVKDLLHPTVFGKGYIGIGNYKRGEGAAIHTTASRYWKGMLERCYSDKYQEKKPTYIGCTVCDDWLNFQNFAEWFYRTFPGEDYQLDKDIKVKHNKLYSPWTCTWATFEENMRERHNV